MEKVGETVMAELPKKSVDQQMKDLFRDFPKPVAPGEFHAAGLDEPWHASIWDINQKYFVWENNTLIAAPQNSNSAAMAVVPNRAIGEKEHVYPIILGQKSKHRILSCVESGGRPELQIVDEDIMKLYNKNEESKSFTFFMKTKPSNEPCNIESVAFPGWFISTSTEPNKPIALSRPGQTEITDFYFNKE